MLKYEDVSGMFPRTKGIVDPAIRFLTVSGFASVPQPKGLFVPVFENSGTLQEAIANGAIASLWSEKEPIPKYTPNHFPIFLTEDLLKGIEDLMRTYTDYLSQQEEFTAATNFIFHNKQLLNEKESSYDIAVMAEGLKQSNAARNKAGEE
ncbi:hypothetical protein [Bacillus sp. REN3]|uniref:hypothetical protein n=1 Tax=Bacillus sp. REN3 TaxID=2802440 RepID=UPI001AEDE666|nr:hypothetical protein [Bacillus sp. REN3]